jgi:tetratricopeptide (TPR) repeat protein
MEILLPILAISFIVWWNIFRSKKAMEHFKWDVGLNSEIQCSECLAWIPREARKCMHCGSKAQIENMLAETTEQENMLAQTIEQLRIYAEKGLLDKAEEVSLELINSDSKMNEDIAITINTLVFRVYLPQKEYEKARVLLERVVNEFSGLQAGIAYGNLGIIEFNSKRIPEAKECFSKSFDLVKGTWAEDEALYYLGLIAINQGNEKKAITLLEKCYEHIESGTDYPQLAKMKLDEIFSQK